MIGLSFTRGIALMIGAVLLALPPAASDQPAAAAAAGPSIQVAAPRKVDVGAPIELTLSVRDASDVAGYEAEVRFDPESVEFGGVVLPDDLRQLGREPGLVATELAQGAAFAVYSCGAS